MKNTSLSIIIGAIVLLFPLYFFSSCENLMGNFLDKAPGVDVTEDTIFSSKTQAETFLASIYEYGIHSNLPYYQNYSTPNYANQSGTLSSGATDESETCAAWYWTQEWNSGSLNASSGEENRDVRFSVRWIALRKIAVLLERIDAVPDITQKYAAQLKAEAKTIRAMNYLEMLKRYGGVPIIDHRLPVNGNLKIPRNTLEETVNFIVKDCDEAVPDLPLNQTGNLKGRVHQGVALAIKSEALLFAASPLFNTATPYLNMPSPADNKLICYGDYQKSRWESAAAAAKAVLDWAKQAGCALITDQGLDKNYRYAWETYDNKEIIFAEKSQPSLGKWSWPWSAISPPSVYGGNSGQSGITPTLNFVRKYEKKDGTSEVWDVAGGNNLQAKMGELDNRFMQTIAGNYSYWNWEYPKLEMNQADPANGIPEGAQTSTCYGGFWLHKLYPSIISNAVWAYQPNSTLYQLNEIYLNYAESMNEAYGPDADPKGYGMTARQALNAIRERSGQPDATETDIKGRIYNEREIELAFDGYRLYDVRRWMIADQDGVMQGNMWGIKIYKIPGTSECRYVPYVFEKRTWVRRMYLTPFPQNEVNKGYLKQNPGY